MERNTFWVLLAIGVSFGVAMELMKSTAPDTEMIKRLAGAQAEMVDDRIENLEEARAGRIEGAAQTARTGTHVAMVIPGKIGETLANAANPVAPKLDANGKPLDPAAAAAAAKKKKEDEKKKQAKKDDKKKKKKKKKRKKTIPGAEETEGDEDEEVEETEEVVAKSGAAMYPGGALVMPPNSLQNEGEQSQRDWENTVLTEPDFKATEKLISAFQTNKVSAEIFYNVVRQMLEDSRTKMRQLGVMALGVTPSVRSFAELATVIESEPSGVTAIKVQAQNYLKKYTDLTYVRSLGGAMQMKDSPFVVFQAMRQFRIAADLHLKPKAQDARDPAENGQGSSDLSSVVGQPTTGQTGNGQPGLGQVGTGQPAAGAARGRKQDPVTVFRPFVPLLQRLQTSYSQQQLKSAATQTLAYLQQLLPAGTATGNGSGSAIPGQAQGTDQAIPGQPAGSSYYGDARSRR